MEKEDKISERSVEEYRGVQRSIEVKEGEESGTRGFGGMGGGG